MADFRIYAGDTSQTVYVRLRDSTTGLGKTALVFNSTGVTCSYTLPGAARAAITLVTLASASAAWSSGGFILVDDTNCKGLYRLDLPNAAVASGKYTIISIEFDGIIEESMVIPLETPDVNTVEWLGTAAATPTTAGVPEVDVTYMVGGLVPAPATAGIPDVNVREWLDVAVTLSTGNKPDVNVNEWADVLLATTNPLPNAVAGASGGIFIAGTNAATTVTTSFTTTFTGSLTGNVDGTVASVTGAVGSVTGAVGSVTGAVGSVTGHTNQTGDNFALIGALGAGLTDITDRLPAALTKGTADSGSTTTMVDAALTQATNDWFKGQWIRFTSTTLDQQMALITGFTAATDTVTFTPAVTTAVAAGHTYEILPANAIISAEALTGHTNQTGDNFAIVNGAAGLVAIDTVVDAIKVKTDFLPSVVAGGTGGVFIAGTNAATTVTTSFTTTFTGNVTGSVDSVTNAVGSVTGAVGSVTGAVGSVTSDVGITAAAVDLIWDEPMAGHVTADTSGLVMNEWQDGGRLDLILDIIAVDTTTDIPALIATAQTDLDTITDADGVILGAAGVNLIWDEAMVETTGAPAITGTMRAFMEYWAALSRNKITQTATTTTLRNDADAADLSTSTVSDDATTFTRGEFSV